MKVKTGIKGGKLAANHNETLMGGRLRTKGLRVKTGVKGGSSAGNHNERILSA